MHTRPPMAETVMFYKARQLNLRIGTLASLILIGSCRGALDFRALR